MDKQREMFEAWQVESGRTDPMWLAYNDEEKSYALNDVQAEWSAWQAAIAAQPTVPDGYKLVPIKPTEKMCLRGCEVSSNPDVPAEIWNAMLSDAQGPTK